MSRNFQNVRDKGSDQNEHSKVVESKNMSVKVSRTTHVLSSGQAKSTFISLKNDEQSWSHFSSSNQKQCQ